MRSYRERIDTKTRADVALRVYIRNTVEFVEHN